MLSQVRFFLGLSDNLKKILQAKIFSELEYLKLCFFYQIIENITRVLLKHQFSEVLYPHK